MLLLHYISNLCNDSSPRPRLTFADWSVVAPGCEHLRHSLAADGLAALQNVVFSTAELHHAADAAGKRTQSHAAQFVGQETKKASKMRSDARK